MVVMRMGRPAKKFDTHYFDIIDCENKAYWLGFIWSDGYLSHRIRVGRSEEYSLKLSVADFDYKHLEKFNNDISGNYQIRYYKYGKSSFKPQGMEARLFITNTYFGSVLKETYGIIPFREDCSKLINAIPSHLMRHFIRGLIDADGVFCHYIIEERNYIVNKYYIGLCGSEMVLRVIENYFISNGFIDNIKRKLQKRHEENDRDKRCKSLKLSGKNITKNILNHIYKDANVYLDRKYEKYLEIVGDIN